MCKLRACLTPLSFVLLLVYFEKLSISCQPVSKAGSEYWHNPCRFEEKDVQRFHKQESAVKTAMNLLRGITLAAKQAMAHVESFKEQFDMSTFYTSSSEMERDWRNTNLIPDEVSYYKRDKEWKNGTLDYFLRQSYKTLQIAAAAFQEINKDMNSAKGVFLKSFEVSAEKGNQVSCAIHSALKDRKLVHVDIGRSILPPFFYQDPGSRRDLRDYLVLTDFYRALKTIHIVSQTKNQASVSL